MEKIGDCMKTEHTENIKEMMSYTFVRCCRDFLQASMITLDGTEFFQLYFIKQIILK